MIVKDFKRPVVMLPEPVQQRTAADLWTFEQLAHRWHCSQRTVARIVGSRIVRMGRKPLVRADVMASIEREREGL